MEPVTRIERRRASGPPADPLAVALALYVETGLTEAEALGALHASVLARAVALGLRLDGERE